TNGLHLTGVTVLPDHPRADTLSSFFAHLLDEVSQLGNFSFNLRVMPPATKHGGAVREGEKPEGLVGEVVNDKADFVIADLEVTRHRASLLEFTRPFLSAKLAALVSRNRKQQSPISTSEQEQFLPPSFSLDDHHHSSSSEVEDNNQQPSQTLRSVLLNSKRVFVRGSVVEDFFRTASDKKVARLMPTAVASLKDAVALLANDTEVAVIGDSARLALIAAHDCQLEVIVPTVEIEKMNSTSQEIGADFSVDFAVGFHHMNAAFHQFNIALEELEVAGRLAELVDTYWKSGPCTREREEQQQQQQQADFSSAGFIPDETVQENHGSSLRIAFSTRLFLLVTFFLSFIFTGLAVNGY
ncbi:hypothetical protein TYRP_014772, partial [Tyrophagus putrescentiae]